VRGLENEKCFEMNFNGKCEEYDSCQECEEEHEECKDCRRWTCLECPYADI